MGGNASDLSSVIIPVAGFLLVSCYCIGTNAEHIAKWQSSSASYNQQVSTVGNTKRIIAVEMTEP